MQTGVQLGDLAFVEVLFGLALHHLSDGTTLGPFGLEHFGLTVTQPIVFLESERSERNEDCIVGAHRSPFNQRPSRSVCDPQGPLGWILRPK
eukprot:5309687-Pyramimonas_sp.AAC.1